MTLQKGFLKAGKKLLPIPKRRLIIGIQIGLLVAVSFYLFSITMRETFRYFSITDDYDIWMLTKKQVQFYNLFYAYLALIFGQAICIAFLFSRPKIYFEGAQRLRLTIIHEQRVLNINFLNWYSKLAIMFGFLFVFSFKGSQYMFNLYEDYYYFFILIVLVLYFQNWVTIRRIFIQNSLKPMLGVFALISILAFGLSFINPIDYKTINQNVLSKSVHHNYNLEIPESLNWKHLQNKTLVFNLYVATSKDTSEKKPVIFADKEIIELNEIRTQIAEWREWLCESDQSKLTVRINIDSDVKMKHFHEIKKELAKASALKIAYAVTPTAPKYDSRFYKDYSLVLKIPPYYPEYYEYDWSYNKVLPTPPLIIIKQTVEPGFVVFNNERITTKQLKTKLKKSIIKDPKKYLIILYTNNSANFKSYINTISTSMQAVNELRQQYCTMYFGNNYHDLYEDDRNKVDKLYPFKLMEISEEMTYNAKHSDTPYN